mmetsp:Transcript_83064/g.220376  ORF Transcript_83064/g.220376 Transcript_83064/m.220376 type:complete len:350 (-) Transcript_83064:60-1109(-)
MQSALARRLVRAQEHRGGEVVVGPVLREVRVVGVLASGSLRRAPSQGPGDHLEQHEAGLVVERPGAALQEPRVDRRRRRACVGGGTAVAINAEAIKNDVGMRQVLRQVVQLLAKLLRALLKPLPRDRKCCLVAGSLAGIVDVEVQQDLARSPELAILHDLHALADARHQLRQATRLIGETALPTIWVPLHASSSHAAAQGKVVRVLPALQRRDACPGPADTILPRPRLQDLEPISAAPDELVPAVDAVPVEAVGPARRGVLPSGPGELREAGAGAVHEARGAVLEDLESRGRALFVSEQPLADDLGVDVHRPSREADEDRESEANAREARQQRGWACSPRAPVRPCSQL